MKITFLGNFNVDYSTESHHLWTYRRLGHEVVTFQEGQAKANDILNSALTSDMFVWTHTHGWKTSGMDEVLRILKEKHIPSVGYHLDLWKGLRREADLRYDHYWNIEYFFTVDKLFIPDLEARGIKAYYLPAGVVENECYIAAPDKQKFPHDIIFAGSKGYHPEWPYRAQLIEWLQETYGDRFGHYGGDGIGQRRITGHELNVLYASAKIVIGDTLCIGYNYPDYFSDRLFETIGRGGFMIFPNIHGLVENFKLGNSCILNQLNEVMNPTSTDHLIHVPELVFYSFKNFEQLKNTINYYLENEKEREAIRLAGHERVKKDHTYTNRLSYILQTIFDDKSN